MKNDTLKYRVGQLEKTVNELRGDMKKLFRNHIPHLEKEIQKFSEEVHINQWKIAAIAAVIAGVLTAIGGKLLDYVF